MALSHFIDAICINKITVPTESVALTDNNTKTDVRRNVHLSEQTCLDLAHFSEKLNTNQSKLIRTILNHVFIGWKQQCTENS